MTELSRIEIAERLERLAVDLDRFPAGVPCPWALARVFNELVKLVKRDLAMDPVIRTLRLLEEGGEDVGSAVSNAAIGTVRALIGQVVVAYSHQEPSHQEPAPASQPEASGTRKATGGTGAKRASSKKPATAATRAA